MLGTFATSALLLALTGMYGLITYSVALAAGCVPALQAAHVDPAIALRYE